MAHYTFKCTREDAKRIATRENFSTQQLDNLNTYAYADNYRSIEWRNGHATIDDARLKNAAEIKEKYQL